MKTESKQANTSPADHVAALEMYKQTCDRWNIDELRKWSRQYTREQYALLDEQSSGTGEIVKLLKAFDDSFYTPVFMQEYLKLGGIQA